MTQPQRTIQEMEEMTEEQIAAELRSWADARLSASRALIRQGKPPLDDLLLREAAVRIESLSEALKQTNSHARELECRVDPGRSPRHD